MLRKIVSLILITILINAISVNVFAADTTTAGTKPFFNPMVIILLDTTPTMNAGPSGYTDSRFGTSTSCTGSFNASKTTTYKVDCSRLAIAQRTLFKVLDYDGNKIINKSDKDNWKLMIGASTYNFLDGYKEIASVNADLSFQQIMCGKSTSCTEAEVENIINDRDNNYATYKCSSSPCLAQVSTNSGTNMVQALDAVKSKFDADCKTGDNGCRTKYVILVTDGTDNKADYTKTCYDSPVANCSQCTIKGRTTSGSSGKDCDAADAYKWRREMILKAKDLATAASGPYKLYVVGFSADAGLPDYLGNTLNWMALWGDTASYDLTQTGLANQETHKTAAIRPSSILDKRSSSCVYSDSPSVTASQCVVQGDVSDTLFPNLANFFAVEQDPGNMTNANFSTFRTDPTAYFVKNPNTLAVSLKGILGAIFSDNYSFTQASLQAVRDPQESFVYEASYETARSDPFWIGHLKRFPICTEVKTGCAKAGDIFSTPDWDAGAVLQARDDSTNARRIQTYIGGSQVDFTTSNVTKAHLGASSDTAASNIITFIRGGESVASYPKVGWKLGDISGSSPLTIGTPNALFSDQWDFSTTTKGFDAYRTDHIRSTSAKTRLILQGANDGQMHLFRSYDGAEVWSFIPPNLLPKLKLIAHNAHPAVPLSTGETLSHQLFVDGQTRAAEIWIDSGTQNLCAKNASTGIVTCNTMTKTKTEWHTYFILSEGSGATDITSETLPSTLWSSSASCDTGFNSLYDSTNSYTHYCGIWAFDVSATTTTTENTSTPPVFKWRIGGSSALSAQTGMHLGQPWSKMFIGRVRENNKEKWVGMMGGGYSGGAANPCPNASAKECSSTEAPGKGFFVIQMGDNAGTTDGKVLWQATHNAVDVEGTVSVANADMDYDLAAPVAAVDTDNDGFLDVAYAPDTAGNVWRFTFCTKAMDNDPANPCTTSNWAASLLYAHPSGEICPIYTSVSVARDTTGQMWVYFGTGDKTNASASNAQEYFMAIKETYTTISGTGSLANLTTAGSTYDPKNGADGWYIKFTGSGEKLLGDPVVFAGNVYFTSYVPRKTGAACDDMGTSYIWGVDYMTAKGAFKDADNNPIRGKELGDGLATGIFASRGDSGWNLYGFLSGGTPHTVDIPGVPNSNAANNAIIYWQDRRVR